MSLQLETTMLDVRKIESAAATEYYITATPADDGPFAGEELYQTIAAFLRESRAWIVAERIFASADALPAAVGARRRALAELDDGVAPTLLLCRDESRGILGVQVHAIHGIDRPTLIGTGDGSAVRVFARNGISYLTASGLGNAALPTPGLQTRHAFEKAIDLIQSAGGTVFDIARTWIWMDDILSWYGDMNDVRSALFQEKGLFQRPDAMPASTGIGVSPFSGRVALDVFAAWGSSDAVRRYHAAGKQRSAYEYGSAFARASRVLTPGGATVFCSGTAAIDPAGRTCYLDNIPGQVQMTIENIRAVLCDLDCGGDVLQAMVYCATPEVESHFNSRYRAELGWPVLTMPADVCRADLLFEVEVTARG